MRWLFLLLLFVPAMEIGVFIWIGGMVGPWWVVSIIILTGALGILLAKRQGMDTWKRAQLRISKGQAPTEELMDGLCILIGSVFLLAPGFITDTVGLILVLPFTRKLFKNGFRKLMLKMASNGTVIYRK
ncbi:FxsA family protein [Oceanobacillus sp. FSL K6-2867]|uniref:FxsA family protein n=1 Tax=Oceanobacillus sp. FSL K6-2867 TaxID=2954748 RepID=UPI0030DB4E58